MLSVACIRSSRLHKLLVSTWLSNAVQILPRSEESMDLFICTRDTSGSNSELVSPVDSPRITKQSPPPLLLGWHIGTSLNKRRC